METLMAWTNLERYLQLETCLRKLNSGAVSAFNAEQQPTYITGLPA